MDKQRIEYARARFKLSDIVGNHTRLKKAAGGFMGLCPFHRETNPSFHVSDMRGTYKCFGCGAWGDVFDFVMQVKAVSFFDAVTYLVGSSETPHTMPKPRAIALEIEELYETQTEDETRRIAHAHALWLRRKPVHGTTAETYLRKTRGIYGPIPSVLGFVENAYCSPLGHETCALIAPLQNSHGHVTAVQQIFLSPDSCDAYRDEKGRRIKRTLGVMQDGSVRLGMPESILGFAGSVEDALAASSIFSLPVWAVCGETRFSHVWAPGVEKVVIFADSDEAGMREAAKARLSKFFRGTAVEIAAPENNKDWAERIKKKA